MVRINGSLLIFPVVIFWGFYVCPELVLSAGAKAVSAGIVVVTGLSLQQSAPGVIGFAALRPEKVRLGAFGDVVVKLAADMVSAFVAGQDCCLG